MLFQLALGNGESNPACNHSEESIAMDSTTVLCIDDLPQALELRKATLESQGYCVKTASSSRTAMKILEEAPVAAVLLEYKEEGIDAEAVACHIKQRFPRLPIILLSAYSEMPQRILWLVDEYLMKSELRERLVPIIERATHPDKIAPRSNKRRQRSGSAA
jgi:DNA-binding NtrC family response regulator